MYSYRGPTFELFLSNPLSLYSGNSPTPTHDLEWEQPQPHAHHQWVQHHPPDFPLLFVAVTVAVLVLKGWNSGWVDQLCPTGRSREESPTKCHLDPDASPWEPSSHHHKPAVPVRWTCPVESGSHSGALRETMCMEWRSLAGCWQWHVCRDVYLNVVAFLVRTTCQVIG